MSNLPNPTQNPTASPHLVLQQNQQALLKVINLLSTPTNQKISINKNTKNRRDFNQQENPEQVTPISHTRSAQSAGSTHCEQPSKPNSEPNCLSSSPSTSPAMSASLITINLLSTPTNQKISINKKSKNRRDFNKQEPPEQVPPI